MIKTSICCTIHGNVDANWGTVTILYLIIDAFI